MALLGASPQVVDRVRGLPEEQQEEAFIAFIEGKHGCLLDWRARRDDVLEELRPLLTTEEQRLLPRQEQCPDDASGTIAMIRQAIAPAGRTLLETESLGDFSILLIVPGKAERDLAQAIGPWLIARGRAPGD
jgi:hypothetical protein